MDSEQQIPADARSAGDISTASHDPHSGVTGPEPSLAVGWADLIDQIKSGAAELNAERARLKQREEMLQALAVQTRDDLRAANERASRAEAQTREVEAQRAVDIAYWEHRALAAEAAMQEMEDWMAKVRTAIIEGFGEGRDSSV